MSTQDPLPSRWDRVHPGDLPPRITVLSLPVLGTSWHHRTWRYWAARAIVVAMPAVLVGVYVLLYKSILWDDPKTRHFGTMWWSVLGFGAVATAEGVRVNSFTRTLPLKQFREDRRAVVRNVVWPPFLLYMLCIMFLAPGIWFSALLDWRAPVTRNERIARKDLDDQLKDHARARRRH